MKNSEMNIFVHLVFSVKKDSKEWDFWTKTYRHFIGSLSTAKFLSQQGILISEFLLYSAWKYLGGLEHYLFLF